ncbi:hypothetical protein Fot_22337 [Forsythia ovata]|uniref:Uncharacterized protein n=1 Tax=Forsythia ovata TaxID=205694 RepID=A0ABD1UXG6_9LAMI
MMPFDIFALDSRGPWLMWLSHTSHLMSSSHVCVSLGRNSPEEPWHRPKPRSRDRSDVDPFSFDNFLKKSLSRGGVKSTTMQEVFGAYTIEWLAFLIEGFLVPTRVSALIEDLRYLID